MAGSAFGINLTIFEVPYRMAQFKYILYQEDNSSSARVGHLDGDQIHPLSWESGSLLTSLYDVVKSGHDNFILTPGAEPIALNKVKVLAPFAEKNILAVGKNYSDHAKEFNSKEAFDFGDKDLDPVPTQPIIFTKKRTSIVSSGTDVYLNPEYTKTVDYEGEIGLIISKPAYKVSKADAWDYVWGYTLINDVSARERQRDHQQFFIGKSLDGFSPIGPVIVRKEVFGPSQDIKFETKVNGEVRQQGDIKDLIFDIPTIIETLSGGFTLEAGDVIATGTPAGVGGAMRPPQFLKDGDVVEVICPEIGVLRNKFVNQRPTSYSENVSASSAKSEEIDVDILGEAGKPLFVFLHGIGESGAVFRPLVDKLQLHQRFQVVLYDFIGSGSVPETVVTLESLVSDLETFLRQLNQGSSQSNITIAGHGLGAIVGEKFTHEHPDLVEKLISTGIPTASQVAAAAKTAFRIRSEQSTEFLINAAAAARGQLSELQAEQRYQESLEFELLKAILRQQSPDTVAKLVAVLATVSPDSGPAAVNVGGDRQLVGGDLLFGDDSVKILSQLVEKYVKQK